MADELKEGIEADVKKGMKAWMSDKLKKTKDYAPKYDWEREKRQAKAIGGMKAWMSDKLKKTKDYAPKYDWEREKRQAKAIGRVGAAAGGIGAAATASVARSAMEGSATTWIFLSFLFYLSDWFTGFNGVNVKRVITELTLSPGDATKIFLHFLVITVFVVYFFVKRPSAREFFSFAINVWLVATILIYGDLFRGGLNLGMLLHLLFAWAVYAYVIKPLNENDLVAAHLTLFVLLFIDFFAFSAIGEFTPLKLFLDNRLIIPFWFIAMVYLTKDQPKGGWAKALIIGVLLFFIINVAEVHTIPFKDFAAQISPEQREEAISFFKARWDNLKTLPGNIVSSITQYKNETMRRAVGDYYTGQVDRKAKEKIGVYLENVKRTEPYFYTDSPVGVYATLVASTLDEESPIKVAFGCIADKDEPKKRMMATEVFPRAIPEVYMNYEADVDCIFDAGTLKRGSHAITLLANFTFRTMAYQKTYFIDKERARALRAEGIDILNQYGIKDKEPKAIHTNGPVEIGIEVRNPPVELDRESELDSTRKTVGFTIRNIWDGEMNKIHNITFIFPSRIRMKDSKCSGYEFDFVQGNEINIYRIRDPRKLGKIETYKSMRCTIEIDKMHYDDILGAGPVATKYFKVNAEYEYSLEKTISVTVRQTEEEKEKSSTLKGRIENIDDDMKKYGGAVDLCLAGKSEGASSLIDQLKFAIDRSDTINLKKSAEKCSSDPTLFLSESESVSLKTIKTGVDLMNREKAKVTEEELDYSRRLMGVAARRLIGVFDRISISSHKPGNHDNMYIDLKEYEKEIGA